MWGGSLHDCCGPQDKPVVWIVETDKSDELEEVAVELGLGDIPSYQIYKRGVLVDSSSKAGTRVTIDSIQEALKSAAANDSSCCAPNSGVASFESNCCPPPKDVNSNAAVCCPDGNKDAPSDPSAILRLVQQSYANTVNKSNGGGCCVSVSPELLGYSQEQIDSASGANLGKFNSIEATLCSTHY